MTTDQHLAPVCPHCGRQPHNLAEKAWCSDHYEPYGRHASDREDYLTEECAAAEERIAALRFAIHKDGECADAVKADRDRWRRRAKRWKRQWAEVCRHSDMWRDANYERCAERDQARADLAAMTERHRTYADGIASAIGVMRHVRPSGEPSRSDREEIAALVLRVQDLIGERDAMTERAREMRAALIDASNATRNTYGDRSEAGIRACHAAGEPIP